jgi:SAM-dependent methyltransferase
MTYSFLKITLPSFKRYRLLVGSVASKSLTRALQYEILAGLENLGDVLDFGEGDKSGYRKLINCNSYKSINIDHSIEPTWLVKAGDSIPCANNTFDTVISLNTFEHIFDAREIIQQLYKTIKPGGAMLISTPFMFPIHAHPDDFFRPTPSWFRQTLKSCGFREIYIVPLSWGPFSAASIVSGMPGPAKMFRMRLILLVDLIYFYLNGKNLTAAGVSERLERHAAAFFIQAIK